MKTKQSYLNEIEKLRQRHTVLFRRGQWVKMQAIRQKIIKVWAAYHQ